MKNGKISIISLVFSYHYRKCFSKILLLLIVAVMFTSCYSVKHFSSEILYPAENVFDKEITDVTLINRSYLPIEKRKQAGIFYKEGTYFRETEYNDSIVSDNALYSLAYRLNESLRFNIVRNDTITKLNNDKDVFLQPLLYDEVKDICDNHGAQAAVSLETFYSFDSLFVVYEGGYRLIRMTRLLSVYKFYFPHDGRLSTIDSKYYDDTLYWSVSGGLFDDLYDDMISRKDALYEVSYNSGIKFAERISPHWQSVNRLYYENSDEKMKLAAQYAELKEWKEAAKIWKEVTVSDKKISSALAKYNMAVASEMIGELDMALFWIEKALLSKSSISQFKKYKEKITERIENQKIVDNQM